MNTEKKRSIGDWLLEAACFTFRLFTVILGIIAFAIGMVLLSPLILIAIFIEAANPAKRL